jgi:hypothetical protein
MIKHGHKLCFSFGMAFIAVLWIIFSTTICLALLRAAARPLPCDDRGIVGGREAMIGQEPGIMRLEIEAPGNARAIPATCGTR